MKTGSGIILLLLAILIVYLGASGKYSCFTTFIKCVKGEKCDCSGEQTRTANVSTNPFFEGLAQLPPLPKIGGLGVV